MLMMMMMAGERADGLRLVYEKRPWFWQLLRPVGAGPTNRLARTGVPVSVYFGGRAVAEILAREACGRAGYGRGGARPNSNPVRGDSRRPCRSPPPPPLLQGLQWLKGGT